MVAKRLAGWPLPFVVAAASLLMTTGTALPDSAYKTSPITKVVLLGTGTPGPDPERSGPCVAIVVNDTPYLVDLGPGVVRRASAAYRKGVKGLHFSKLKTAFITHLHSDHTVGFPDFIFTPWVVGRTGPVQVYGPSGIKAMTDHILEAWKEDIRIRTEGMEKDFPQHNDSGYKVDVHEISPGVVYQDNNVTVPEHSEHQRLRLDRPVETASRPRPGLDIFGQRLIFGRQGIS
jgi:ribonuclease BN (tRNA processing enzyme)